VTPEFVVDRLRRNNVYIWLLKRIYSQHKCQFMQNTFGNTGQRMDSIRISDEGVRNHMCSTCGKAFQSKNDMTRHVDSVHLKKPVWQNLRKDYPGGKKPIVERSCEFCGEKFYHALTLRQHISSNHKDVVRFECRACAKTCISKDTLYKHLQTNHENDDYQCKFCQELFKLIFKKEKPGDKMKTIICYDNQKCYSCENENSTQSQKYIHST